MLPLLRYGLNSRVKKVLMLCDGIGETSMPIEAAPIASLNLSISHGSLSKNMTKEQNGMFQIEPCAKQQI